MSETPGLPPDRARMILHPTDFSESSEHAFAHALRVATHNRSRLAILHVLRDEREEMPWDKYPPVRSTLERWGFLEPGSGRSDIAEKLGVKVEKAVGYSSNVAESVAGFVVQRPVDMIVIATRGRDGLPRWLKPSVAEPIARETRVPTLFVPQSGRGCVSLEDGHVTLEQVLVPVDHYPNPRPALERALRALQAFGSEQSTLSLLHVGDGGAAPDVPMPTDMPWPCSRLTRSGDPAEQILKTADELLANLIVMVTAGRQGFLDVWRGSTTEQVVRRAPCPVLAVPFDF